jgi:hypothetical protein
MVAPAAFVFNLKHKEGYFKSTKPIFQNKQGPAVIKGRLSHVPDVGHLTCTIFVREELHQQLRG